MEIQKNQPKPEREVSENLAQKEVDEKLELLISQGILPERNVLGWKSVTIDLETGALKYGF